MIITWFELNSEGQVGKQLADLTAWHQHGGLIVTSHAHNVEAILNKTTRHGLRPASGFKTSDITDLYDAAQWNDARELASRLHDKTRKPVVLENETLLKAYKDERIDTDRLADALAGDWPPIWWWYGPIGKNQGTQAWTLSSSLAAAQAIQQCSLIVANAVGFTSPHSQQFESVPGVPLIDIIYLDDERYGYWPLADAGQAVTRSKTGDAILYPGAGDIARADEVVI